MPAKSGKQYRFMTAVAHGGLKGTGVPQDVASEFVHKTPADKRSKFSKAIKKRRTSKYSKDAKRN